MPKRKSKKEKDFQKVKFKVGKKLPKSENVTSTAFKSKSIIIKEQLKETSADDLRQEFFRKSRDPQELLAHLQHYNPSFRLNALNTIKAIMTSDAGKLTLYMGAVLDRVSSLSSDAEKAIRGAALECMRSIFSCVTSKSFVAFIPIVTAHLRCAMTHLAEAVKLDSLQFLDLLISHYPQAIGSELFKLTENFLDLISTRTEKGKRLLKVSPNSKLSTMKWRQQAFSHLERLLSTGVKPESVDTIDSPQSTLVELADGTDVDMLPARVCCEMNMYMSAANIEQHSIRRQDIGRSADESSGTLLEDFIRDLLPLLAETWVELISNDAGIAMDALVTLLSVVNIITQLSKMVHSSEIKDPQPIILVMKTEVRNFIDNGFPVVGSDHKAAKDKRKSSISQSTGNVTSTMLNLKLCSLAGIIGCETRKTHNYMLKFLQSSDLSPFSDQLDTLVLNLEPGELLEKVISHMVCMEKLAESRIIIITTALSKLMDEKERFSSTIEDMMVKLACVSGISCLSLNSVVTLINQACLTRKMSLRTRNLTMLIQRCMNLRKQSTSLNQLQPIFGKTISLLQHVDEITAESLRLLHRLSPDLGSLNLMNLLLQVLYNRTKNGGLSDELHISFLISVLNGHVNDSNENAVQLHNVKSVMQHIIYITLNPQQITGVVEHHYRQMKTTRTLPFHFCSALLQSWCTEYFSCDFLSDVLVSYLSHTTDISEASNSHITQAAEKILQSATFKGRRDVSDEVWAKLNECSLLKL